jgi:predicted nucleotide-binding protein
MPDLTKEDKLSILKRLVKRVDNWRFQKSLPMIVFLGKPSLSRSSPEFQQWLEDANEGIAVVFGKYSHWSAEFNDIEYYEMMSALLGDTKADESNFWKGLDQAQSLLKSMIEEIEADRAEPTIGASVEKRHSRKGKPCIFIGHGRSQVWARLKLFLQEDLNLRTECYESESRVGESIVPILEGMLEKADFAVLILTAEDETATGSMRARQNVIHEVGLFQSKLGFNRAIILKQEGVEDFTNIAGLQYIPFPDNNIEQSFYPLQRTLKKEGLL